MCVLSLAPRLKGPHRGPMPLVLDHRLKWGRQGREVGNAYTTCLVQRNYRITAKAYSSRSRMRRTTSKTPRSRDSNVTAPLHYPEPIPLGISMHVHIHTYMTCLRTYIRAYLRHYIHMYTHAHLLTYFHVHACAHGQTETDSEQADT